jgi:hypothetical protein
VENWLRDVAEGSAEGMEEAARMSVLLGASYGRRGRSSARAQFVVSSLGGCRARRSMESSIWEIVRDERAASEAAKTSTLPPTFVSTKPPELPTDPLLSLQDVLAANAEGIKLFNKWSVDDVEVKDISLTDYIQVRNAILLPHTAGRYAAKQFRKAQMPIVERLVNS